MKPLCIYHGNCLDGFTSAWIVHTFFKGDVDLYPGIYQDPPPPIEPGRPVIFVDFSYKRDVMLEMLNRAAGILLIDHHKSAIEDLQSVALPIDSWTHFRDYIDTDSEPIIYSYFDTERSGAGLAWDFFNPGIPRPQLVSHVEDRDLWRFTLFQTREINAALFSYEYDLDIWNAIMGMNPSAHASDGMAIERKHHKDIRELLKVVTRDMIIDGHIVPVANLPYTYTSDAGHELCKANPELFAACYWDTPKGRVFSLRSREEGMDVSVIAKKYGGGGHKNAAGFRVPYSHLHEFEVL